jgi:hypothetical protein
VKAYLLLFLVVGCGNDTKYRTRAFVAPAGCGQGPYDVHFKADGKTGGDGVEIIACTPRRISGHVMFAVSGYEVANHPFGDVADNQRCMGGRPTIVTAVAEGTARTSGGGGGGEGRASAASPALVERPYSGTESPFGEDLCKDVGVGLVPQQILGSFMMLHAEDNNFMAPGSDMHVRIWSDVPNDLEGVVFMVRHLTSKKTKKQAMKDFDEAAKDDTPATPRAKPPKGHGPPPAPLVEEQPPQPIATATWIPGYWSWTGSTWGWVAGFWRDQRVAMPAPRVELVGEAPQPGAIWIGGSWSLRAGQYVWVTGRWRAR